MGDVKVYHGYWQWNEEQQDKLWYSDCPPGSYVSVEDCIALMKLGWNDGYQACSDILAGKPSPWDGQETTAALKRLGGE